MNKKLTHLEGTGSTTISNVRTLCGGCVPFFFIMHGAHRTIAFFTIFFNLHVFLILDMRLGFETEFQSFLNFKIFIVLDPTCFYNFYKDVFCWLSPMIYTQRDSKHLSNVLVREET